MPAFPAWLAWCLPAALAVQRVAELLWSRRNRAIAGPGASADSTRGFAAMVASHAGLVLLPPLERVAFDTRAPDLLAWSALVAFVAAQALRYAAIASLGTAWNVRAVVTPELGVATRGPYRWMRHPNYLAVLVEFASVPLVLGAWRSWIVLNALHAPVLLRRVRNEERLLARVPGYAESMSAKGGLFPRIARRRAPETRR